LLGEAPGAYLLVGELDPARLIVDDPAERTA
jgi:hypothetical protein